MRAQVNIVIIATSFAFLALSCNKQEQTATAEKSIAVQAQVVHTSDEDLVRTFTGTLEGEQQAVLFAKLSEAVSKVLVHEGESVKADQILISLDRFGASTHYAEVLSRTQNAEKTYRKMEALYKEGAISESQRDDAKTGYEVAKANLDAVERLTDVSTPIDGTVTSVDVSPGEFAQLGQKLATVATVRKLRIKFGVNAANIGYFARGAEVTITSDMVAQTGHGNVVAVAGSADPVSRSFEVEALIDNSEGYFRPGMFVKVNIVQARMTGVLAIPRTSVVSLDNKDVVFTVVNGKAKRHEVTLGQDLDGRVVIQSGLADGDTLVTLGQTYLEDGFNVTLASTTEAGR